MSEAKKTDKKTYKQKGAKEESKTKDDGDSRPKTADAEKSGGRGGRGRGQHNDGGSRGRGAGNRGNRPQTTRDGNQRDNANRGRDRDHGDGEDRKESGGGGRGGRGGRGNRGDARPEQDKNSWIYKYHNMERQEYEQVKFTKDTVIPELPAPKERLKEPSKADFDKEMALEDQKINACRAQQNNLRKKRREIIEGGKVGGSNMTYRESLSAKISELKEVNNTKRKFQSQLKDIGSQIDTLENEKRNLLKDMHKDYHSVDEVKRGIEELEYKQKVTTMTNQQERETIRQIEQLKRSVPKAERFSEIKPQIASLNGQKKEVWDKMKVVKAEVAEHEAEIEKIRKEIEIMREGQTDVKEQADAVSKQIDKIEEDLTAVFAAKDEKREAYWKARYDHKLQRDHVAHIEWMQRQKDRAIQREAEREEVAAERDSALKNLPHPFAKELETCDHLIAFLHTLKVRAGLEGDSEQVARETQLDMLSEANKEKMQKKLEEGKIEAAVSKRDRDAQALVQVGGGGKRKGKKQKAAVEYEDAFNIDLVVVRKFSLLGVSAPVAPEDLDPRIKEVEEKKAWYEENGEAKMKEQVAEFQKAAEEEDQQWKQQAEDDSRREEESRGRGGYGRARGRGGGDRGGYRGGRGGRGRGRGGLPDAFRARNEFEGEEDDDYVYSKPAKPAKKPKQKAEDLVVDDTNYPALGDV